MNENSQDILEIIDESFLRDEEKQALKIQLAKEGPSAALFVAMNTLLINELKKRSNAYEKIVEDFETNDSSLENEYENKKQELGNSLDDKLSAIDPVNTAVKEKIFDQYYQDVDTAQTNYKKDAHELYSGLSLAIIKGMSKDGSVRACSVSFP